MEDLGLRLLFHWSCTATLQTSEKKRLLSRLVTEGATDSTLLYALLQRPLTQLFVQLLTWRGNLQPC